MRFKTDLKNVRTFSSGHPSNCTFVRPWANILVLVPELTAALNSLEKIGWMRLDDDTVRFTVIPDTGSQVWAYVLPRNVPVHPPN